MKIFLKFVNFCMIIGTTTIVPVLCDNRVLALVSLANQDEKRLVIRTGEFIWDTTVTGW